MPGHLDSGLQVLEGPDDALQVARRLAVLGEEGHPVRGADPRVIEVDRDLGPVRIERHALQAERPIELQVAPFLEKEILALIEPQHDAAVELARVAVLGEEDRVVDHELRELVDDHVREMLIVAVGRRRARIDLERLVGLFVERNDAGHRESTLADSTGCSPYS